MFRFLNKIIDNNPLKKALRNSKGQAAVVLILVIAIVLIFYAVTLNFGYLSQTKALLTIASNTSVAMLASNVASFAQMLSSTQLKGKLSHSKWTGVMAAIITAFIVGIGILISVLTANPGPLMIALSITVAVGGIVLQAVVINPMITGAWNSIIQQTLSMGNQFTEGAIQSALSKVVTDSVVVPDVVDSDGDGIWVDDPSLPSPWVDTTSRYAAYYSHRLKNMSTGPVEDIGIFLAGLDDLVHEDCDDLASWGSWCPDPAPVPPDSWGIHDHLNTEDCFGVSECQPCCLPDEIDSERIRQDNCEIEPLAGPFPTWDGVCGDKSPQGATYPWVFNPAYENPNNTFYSFREEIGRDDEHRDSFKNIPPLPPGPPPYTLPIVPVSWDPNTLPIGNTLGTDEFYLEDATNYYIPPYYEFASGFPAPNPIPEKYKGIYPFFHKMAGWGVELSKVDPLSATILETRIRECHWCDARDVANCPDCYDLLRFLGGVHPHPTEIPQLKLPLVPSNPSDGLAYNTTYFVDGANLIPGNPPLWVDKVSKPENIFADDNECAEDFLDTPIDATKGFWKKGSDQYCSTNYPYSAECNKHRGNCDPDDPAISDNCNCGDSASPALPSEFPDDAVDSLYTGLGFFVEWAEALLGAARGSISRATSGFGGWYSEAARWIEGPSSGPCFLCDLQDPPVGFLYSFLDDMRAMRDRTQQWIDRTPYAGSSCTEVWCVPPENANCNPVVRPDEEATFDSNLNGIRGDTIDIISCLTHNIGPDDESGGNAVRFQNCLDSCSACQNNTADCFDTNTNQQCGGLWNEWQPPPAGSPNALGAYLPRSLIPGFKPYPRNEGGDFDPVNEPRLRELINCALVPGGVCDTCYGVCTNTFNICVGSVSEIPCSSFVQGPGPGSCGCEDIWEFCASPCITARLSCLVSCSDPTACATCLSDEVTCMTTGAGAACDADRADCIDLRCTPEQIDCNGDCTCTNTAASTPPFNFDCESEILASPTSSPPVLTNYNTELCVSKGESCAGNVFCNLDYSLSSTTEFSPDVTFVDPGFPLPVSPPPPSGFLESIYESIPEAENQVVKFRHRREFLQNRVEEAANIVNILDDAVVKFDDFLKGPATVLINARINYVATAQGLPYHVIYGWKDEDNPDRPPGNGRWHIIKAEARIIEYCDNACAPDQVSQDPGWPRIDTKTTHWGTRRKYYLVAYEGSVKFRITRFDEERDSGFLRFPNGVSIWNFRSGHPNKAQGPSFNADLLDSECQSSTIETFDDGATTVFNGQGIYRGAFIMNSQTTGLTGNSNCWNLSNKLLSRGAMTETCAQYGWEGTSNNGKMSFKFVPCKNF